jgi:hypothetical protein
MDSYLTTIRYLLVSLYCNGYFIFIYQASLLVSLWCNDNFIFTGSFIYILSFAVYFKLPC